LRADSLDRDSGGVEEVIMTGPTSTRSRRPSRRAALAGGLALPLSGLAAGLARAQSEPETGTLITRQDDASHRLTTPVHINGKGPFRVVIDTGANRSVISTELASSLGLPAGRPARVHGIAGPQEAPTVNIDELRIGVIKARLSQVPTLAAADMGTDGLLGLDVFKNKQVTFDFLRDVVRVERSQQQDTMLFSRRGAASTDVTVRAVQRFGQLTIVDADAAKVRIACFIDSGAQRSVGNMAMRRAVQARTADRNLTPFAVNIIGATGQAVRGEVAEVPTMRVGGVNFTSFPLAFADLHTFSLWGLQDKPALMIGMDLMGIFDVVSMDFGARVVRFRLSGLMA
jgi:hypothetical protein